MEETFQGQGRYTWMDARRKRGLTLAGSIEAEREEGDRDEMVGWASPTV